MRSGNAPLGNDGKPINLHHLTQTETNRLKGTKGVLAEVQQTFHKQKTSKLHMPHKTDGKINQRSFRYDRFKDTVEYRDKSKQYVSVDSTSRRTKNKKTGLKKQIKTQDAKDFDKFQQNYWKNRIDELLMGQ